MAVIGTLGSPMKNGPLQLPATLGSEVTLRRTQLVVSAAHSSVPTTSRRCGKKPAGNAQLGHVQAARRTREAALVDRHVKRCRGSEVLIHKLTKVRIVVTAIDPRAREREHRQRVAGGVIAV